MARDPIHPDFPYTDDEYAAACVLLGGTADRALRDAAELRAELATHDTEPEGDEGWSMSPRVFFLGDGFSGAIALAADIASDGNVLSPVGRAAWLDAWTVRLTVVEANSRLDELDLLGARWSSHRSAFFRLLTGGYPPEFAN